MHSGVSDFALNGLSDAGLVNSQCALGSAPLLRSGVASDRTCKDFAAEAVDEGLLVARSPLPTRRALPRVLLLLDRTPVGHGAGHMRIPSFPTHIVLRADHRVQGMHCRAARQAPGARVRRADDSERARCAVLVRECGRVSVFACDRACVSTLFVRASCVESGSDLIALSLAVISFSSPSPTGGIGASLVRSKAGGSLFARCVSVRKISKAGVNVNTEMHFGIECY